MQTVFVGRQPILNHTLDVFGYELLFRDGETNEANFSDPNLATSSVMRAAFLDMDLLRLTRGLKCFINVTREFLLDDTPFPLPPDQIVLEVFESEEVDDQLVEAITKLSSDGVQFALDDYIGDTRWDPLLETVDYVKVDIMQLSEQELNDVVEKLKPFKIKLLAEKVESQEDLALCSSLGFRYFQGYFFARPELISGKALAANQLQALELLAELQNEEADIDKVQNIIARDMALSYGILRYINSAAFGISRNIESVRDAVNYIGLKPLTRWMTLLVLTNSEDQNEELMALAIIRARMCELLAEQAKLENQSAFFTAGLFSMLEPIMRAPMQELMDKLPLTPELQAALVSRDGIIGEAIQCVEAYEDCGWDGATFMNQDFDDVVDIYTQSVYWANDTVSAF